MSSIDQAVILAGGLGTRLRPFTLDNPKPMYPIQGRPYLEYLLEQVRSFGIEDVVLLLGYLPEKIEEHFGDGSEWGVNITYRVTPVELDTGARLREALPVLRESFLMMYCDNYCPIDFTRLCADFARSEADIQVTAYANRDGYTRSNLRIAEDGQVLVYDKKRVETNLAGVDIGYALVRRDVLGLMPQDSVNFEAAVYPQCVARGTMYATLTEHRYYSVGSFERIALTEQFFSHRRCVFLDRDGTLNVRPPKACYITKAEDFSWLPGAREAVRRINDAGMLAVLVSNQPGIARGAMTDADYEAVNAKMVEGLAEAGARLDAIYTCKHNWDDGCFCRKPKPGMLYEAQRDFSLDLTECYLVGDDERDIEAGEAARCTCYQVTDDRSALDCVNDILEREGC